jgi:rubredoxin
MSIMENELDVNYVCPDCRSYLRVWNNIIFSVKSCTEDKMGLLLLNPELGNYEFISHHKVEFNKMDCLDYYCPVCNFDLTAKNVNKNFARIVMIDKNNTEFDVYFSRLRGQHSTFKVSNGDIVEKFGKDSSSYVDYFMAKFKKGNVDKKD